MCGKLGGSDIDQEMMQILLSSQESLEMLAAGNENCRQSLLRFSEIKIDARTRSQSCRACAKVQRSFVLNAEFFVQVTLV